MLCNIIEAVRAHFSENTAKCASAYIIICENAFCQNGAIIWYKTCGRYLLLIFNSFDKIYFKG